jgi:hypothetical protein
VSCRSVLLSLLMHVVKSRMAFDPVAVAGNDPFVGNVHFHRALPIYQPLVSPERRFCACNEVRISLR